MHIAIVTAGGAGMFCGSCMHDNSWARALIAAGHEVSLVPTYTPIRVDEPSLAGEGVFFGGVNVYLNATSRIWRSLPRGVKRWLDRPGVLNLVSRMSSSNDASKLGDLTLGMLEGEQGPHASAVDELAEFLAVHVRPDVVIFSNALLSGAVRRIRDRVRGPVVVVLQGDDVFLDSLPPSHRQSAVAAVSARAHDYDAYFTHSRFYRDYIAKYLSLPVERFEVLPLSIDPTGHHGQARQSNGPFTIGYFARIAPEKGLHHLVDAFEALRSRRSNVRLRVGGYLGKQHRRYFEEQTRKVRHRGNEFEYIGSPDTLAEKVDFFRGCDVLSVPTEFLEPKGLYVLEALANGVPVVQPAHGSFPELIDSTGGGWLVPPRDPAALADQLGRIMDAPEERLVVAQRGHAGVRERHSPVALAAATAGALEQIIAARSQ
jgi:glycosyltransferase involved in cell wall biosynthesis